MKKYCLITTAAIILVFTMGVTPGSAGLFDFLFGKKSKPKGKALTIQLKWNNYKSGMEMAKKEGKDVYIGFITDWCHYCRKMEAETYSDNKVAAYMEENFILIRVNGDKEADLAKSFAIRAYPTSWFLDPAGKKLMPIMGYLPPDEFLHYLKYIKERHNIKNWSATKPLS